MSAALFLAAAVVLPLVLLRVARRIGESTTSQSERDGEALDGGRALFPARYLLVAMLFLVFDVAIVFLVSWAVIYSQLAIFGLVEMVVFLGILGVGYYYAWRKGALEPV